MKSAKRFLTTQMSFPANACGNYLPNVIKQKHPHPNRVGDFRLPSLSWTISRQTPRRLTVKSGEQRRIKHGLSDRQCEKFHLRHTIDQTAAVAAGSDSRQLRNRIFPDLPFANSNSENHTLTTHNL